MPDCPNCGKPYNPGDEVCQTCGYILPFSADVLAPGTVLHDRYEIQELFHTGGMGYVYLAKDKNLYDRLRIVKQVKEPVKSDAELLKKLQEEAVSMAKLDHPDVAMILDHFVEGNYYFLVVERISGQTLREVFDDRHGQLTEQEVVGWAISMCDVLSYIHGEGVIHRDISPDNIMLTGKGTIKFIDFGTLRELRDIASRGTAGIGKIGYTPPEQWLGKPVRQSDIFALGATIYRLLTGFLPLSKEYLSGQGSQKEDFNPIFPPVRQKNAGVSRKLEAVLQKALRLDVHGRYSSATEFGQALTTIPKPVGETGPLSFTRQELDQVLERPDYSPDKLIALLERGHSKEFKADAHVSQGYSIKEHTLMVMRQFEKYFSGKKLPAGTDANLFRVILVLHDIGKTYEYQDGVRIEKGKYTSEILKSALSKLGYSQQEVSAALALVSEDPIGDYLKEGGGARASAIITRMATRAGFRTDHFLDLLLIYYMADAGSYTEDAGAKRGLDRLFVFDTKNKQMRFAPDTANKIERLRIYASGRRGCMWVTDHVWHDVEHRHLRDWVKTEKNKRILHSGQVLIGTFFRYRRDLRTRKYQVQLRPKVKEALYVP